jgi:hypothetical protein
MIIDDFSGLGEDLRQCSVPISLEKQPQHVARVHPRGSKANALRIDWNEVLPDEQCSFVLGNPPFVGKKEQNAEQKADMNIVWGEVI